MLEKRKMIACKEIFEIGEDYYFIEALMTYSFPIDERRPAQKQRLLLVTEAAFHCTLIMHGEKRAGFLNWWELPGCNYCEHFALTPQLRGLGIGGEVLVKLRMLGPLLLEVEMPHNAAARRRIGFYERNGLLLWDDVPYWQPAYSRNLKPVPMLLMASGEIDRKSAQKVIETLKSRVYGWASEGQETGKGKGDAWRERRVPINYS